MKLGKSLKPTWILRNAFEKYAIHFDSQIQLKIEN